METVLSGWHDTRLHGAFFKMMVDSRTSPGPPPTHFLVARALVHEDGGRNHDAPFDDFVLSFFPRRQKSDLPMPHTDTEPYESKRLQQEEVNNCNNAPDIKGLAVVPQKTDGTPWAVVPDGSSCRIKNVSLVIVTLQIKSKVTSQCNPGQVDINELGGKNTTNLLEEKASSTKDSNCCCSKSPSRLGPVDAHEECLSIACSKQQHPKGEKS